MRPFDGQVAEILNFIAELRDSTSKSGDANRPRTEIHTGHALAKAQRHAENADAFSRAWKIAIVLTLLFVQSIIPQRSAVAGSR